MSVMCWILNSLICGLYKKEYIKFLKVKDPMQNQKTILLNMILNNKDTIYGKKFNFKNINTIKQFQISVPLSEYEDYIPYIYQMKNGEKNVITSDEIKLFELTSGSTSSSKLIPYTSGLKNQFLMGIRPWIYNVYKNYPKIKNGKSYWSITPVIGNKEFTIGGTPIGFEDDSEYFGILEKYLFRKIFAVSNKASEYKDMDEFYMNTAIDLIRCKNLSLISIWSPTFLILIIDYISRKYDKILKSIAKNRRSEVKKHIENNEIYKIWPNLEVISCWGDANSKSHYYVLKSIFPNVTFQLKGIISTEGFISFPLVGMEGSILSVNSHFFEFISIHDENIYLLSDLEVGKQYEVIITTAGGFYRYKTNDIVTIINKINNIPVVKFSGRRNNVCDLFGEKLNACFLQNIINKLCIHQEFYMFAPKQNGYVLYIKTNDKIPNIEKELCENFHYNYCRKLGQLQELKIFKLKGDAIKEYTEFCVKSGQKLGNIKLQILSKFDGWDKIFTGEYE